MTQNSTAQPYEKTTKKFIELPSKSKDRILEEICYGNSRLGALLDYFIYGANLEAERHGLEESCKVVTLTRKHKDIFDTLKKLKFNISRKTFVRYIALLNELGYVLSQSYGKTFDVQAEAILNAIKNPPQKSQEEKSCNVVDKKKKVVDEERVELEKKVVELQQKVVESDKKVYLLQQKVDILSHLQLLEPYLGQLVELAQGISKSPYSNNSNNLVITSNVSIDTTDETAKLTDRKNDQETINANTSSPTTDERPDTPTSSNLRNNLRVITPDTSLSPSSMEDIKDVEQLSRTNDTVLPIAPVTTRKRVSKNKTANNQSPSQKPLLELNKQETYLSEKAREVWEAWCEMPWNKDINPPLTSTAAAHCETLSKVEITKEIMFKVLNFARKNDINGFYKNKPLQLGHIVKEYPRWRSATQEIPETKEDKLQSYKPMDLAARNAYNRERYSKKPTTEQPSNVVKLPVTAIAR